MFTILLWRKYANLDVSDHASCRATSPAVYSYNAKVVGLLQGHVYTNHSPSLTLGENPWFFALSNTTTPCIEPFSLPWLSLYFVYTVDQLAPSPACPVYYCSYPWRQVAAGYPTLKPSIHIPIKSWDSESLLGYLIRGGIGHKRVRRRARL